MLENVEDIYELSPVQSALLATELEGGSCAQFSCSLLGQVDVAALQWAWQQVLNRHAILRTSFVWKRLDKPVQIVNRELLLSFTTYDWRAASHEEQRERLQQLRRDELGKGIDPSAPPLLRLAFASIGDDAGHLLCTYHPLILDERSLRLLVQESLAYYETFGNGRNPQLSPADSFSSYIKWIKTQDFAGAEKFWRESLKDFDPQGSIAEKYSREALAVEKQGRDEYVAVLPLEIINALGQLADDWTIPFETLMPGAWALLLHRESGIEDLVFGVAKAAEVPNGNTMLGPLSHTLPVRVRIKPNASVRSYIESLAVQLERISRNSFCSLEQVRNWSALNFKLFECIIAEGETLDANSSLKTENIAAAHVEAEFVITLPRAGETRLSVNYDRGFIARETVHAFVQHFRTLLSAIIGDPNRSIRSLPILTPSEERQVLTWNETSTSYPRASSIHDLFAEQARLQPDAIAAVFADTRLTYSELNTRANQLAHHLQMFGVQPETRVALCVERSLEMLIGILGILKAGGAYVPIDPAYPLERIAFMLEDLQSPVILTQEHLLERLPAHWGQVICLDGDWETISTQSDGDPVSHASSENLAYVMYTSGSTGTPKGVSVTHRAVVRLVRDTNYLDFDREHVFLQFAPISFDASTLEIWGALLNGGRLVVMPPALPSLDVLGEAIRKNEVTTLWLTAGLFHLMVDERVKDLSSLKQLVAGGDALSPHHVRKALQALPGCRLVNGYGPTENTTFTCCYSITDANAVRNSVPIGKPISNTQVLILDEQLRPVPVGMTGALYVGGDGLARDYHNQPALTAERYIPNPFADAPGQRLYATGDLVRYLPDGNIEFLGRSDRQVKVRGFRIELGEIETALNTHPSLQDAVVVARADVSGEKQLVAYVVPSPQTSVSPAELRDSLKQRLPEHMLPSTFVFLEALPLTTNGKVDRQALPAPDSQRTVNDNYVGPRTAIEELLTLVWSQALGVEQVGIDDNFFALGGDSIRSVQVLAKVQERGLGLTLQDLFQYQTIRELALVATAAEATPEPTTAFDLISDDDRQQLPAEVEDAYPLTMLQAGMVFHSELNPDAGVYHDIFSHHVRAPFNPDALRVSLDSLVQQHAALRTCFALEGFSEPLQLVQSAVEIPLHVDDLRNLSDAEQDAFLREHLTAEKERGFDWSRAPLISFELHRRTNESFQFTVSFHHAILDGWSLASMLAELFQNYFSQLEQHGPSAEIKPLASSYRDYVARERMALASAESQRYWSEKLSGSDGDLKHWAVSESSSDGDQRMHKIAIDLSAEVATGLKALATSASVPLKTVLLAAHLKVLGVLSGHSDVITGLVANGRPEQGDGERLLGLFLNTIPLRQQLRSATWVELVQQTFQSEWEALPHRWYPLAQMQREQGGGELFQTAFNFTHFHVARTLQEGTKVELIDSINFEQTNFPFFANFSLGVNSADIHLSIDADSARFTWERAEEITDYYLRTLTAMATEPHANHTHVSLLSEVERETLLVEWNNTRCDYASDKCAHQLFEAQVKRTPDAIAAICDQETLTYAELNARANQLAGWLSEIGVRPEARVALCIDRSLDMLVALFGVLKAGAAYVPLDRAYPRERLAFTLENAQVELVLAHEAWADALPQETTEIVWLDREWAEIEKCNADDPEITATPQNLAYVIYTSGSTGQPKGVMINHSALVNYVESASDEFKLGPADRVLQFASLTFDVAVEEIFCSLTRGATLVLRTEAMMSSVAAFLKDCEAAGVTVLDLPTAYWHFLTGELVADDLQLPHSVRLVVLGGERALPERWAQWRSRVAGSVEVKNSYGPTETTIAATVGDLRDKDISIGRPVANTEIYLLDSNLQPVPLGVAGEICIGGNGLARGYWNEPGLTAERFVPDGFSHEPGSRLYRTGDRARYRSDGQIEFIGRMDHQIKIRGFRVELGEIEARLREYPGVNEAVVVVRTEKIDDVSIAAYIVADDDSARPESLRAFLQERLPEHMVPTSFVRLSELPLTPAGKVDQPALPAPDADALAISVSALTPPRTEIEYLLHSIWSEVLKVENFGIHDNFFALGGHSLLATQVITRVRKVFEIEAPLRELFVQPTVAKLAHWIEIALRGETRKSPPLVRAEREGHLPLSFAQQRLWFIDQLQPGSSLYNIPLALRLRGELDVPILERVFTEIVRRHEVLRTHFELIDGEPVQVVALPEQQRLHLTDLSLLSSEERNRTAVNLSNTEARTPFDLGSGPLLRARLLKLSDEEHIALVTMHHVISDGWSVDVLMREVAVLYDAFKRGENSPLSEIEIQYADYAVWQREWLQGEELERQTGYWRKQLEGAPSVLELPQDFPRPPVQSHQGATYRFILESEVSERVLELSRARGMTTFMILLAAWQVLLKRLSGSNDISVGTVVAGRVHPQVEPLIGFFVNTLVLRSDLSGDPTFAELLKQVRELCLEAFSNQDVPFEKLVEELAPERSMAHAPLFQVMMVMQQQQQHQALAQIEGLTVSGADGEAVSAKFDLTMNLRESGGVIGGALEYNTDIFAADSITMMVQQWQRVLAAAVADPALRISELPLLGDDEEQRLLTQWNEIAEYVTDGTLSELFEAQVERTPQATALVCDDVPLTYAELNTRANQLAHHLQKLGIGPDELVGVCMERSTELVIALLGVLKAGGAYVPLDPAYPKERLAFMVEDTQLRVIVSQEKLLDHLPEHNATVVCLDSDRARISLEPATNPEYRSVADNTAYVIYTSGSTGKPKGVAITHRNVMRLFESTRDYFKFGERDVWTLFHSYAFDFSVWELWGALLYGGRLVVVPYLVSRSPEAFYSLLVNERVTVLNQTPSAFRQLIEIDRGESTPLSLRYVIFGGEALDLNSLQPWFDRHGDEQPKLVNMYGITETTVHVTYRPLKISDIGTRSVIGGPLPDLRVCALDEHLHLVPAGVAGEMYVGGAGLGRGYLNRPELTAQRFIPDPFSTEPGARLYKTGDVARFLKNGELEYLGRADDQVKIRGFRVELGEIEAVLNQHPLVSAAAIVLQEGTDQRLVAYYVSDDPTLTTSDLRLYIKDRLPDYMVPSVFVSLDHLPLTTNGKVDRRALQSRNLDSSKPREESMTPRDSLEFRVTQIWEDVLNVKPIGVKDNFFELGGHSFLAVRLMAQIKEQTGLSLPLALLMQEGTVEALARELREQRTPGLASPLVAIRRDGSAPPFFCVHPAGGNVLCYSALARHVGPDGPFYGLQARGLEDGQEPFTSVESAACYYLGSIRTVQPEGPYFIGGWSLGGLIAFEMARMLQAQGQQVALLALFDSYLHDATYRDDDDATILINSALHLGLPQEHLPSLRSALNDVAPETQIDFALDHIRRLNLLPPGLEEKQARRLIEVYRANLQAARDYVPQPTDVQITFFKALTDDVDPVASWLSFARGGVDVHEINADHFAMMREPHVRVVAEHLNHSLQHARDSQSLKASAT